MKKLFPYIFLVFLFSCSQNKKTFEKLNECEWLIGAWQTNAFEYPIVEVWKYENDSTYSGYSYIVINGDTTITETILIQQRENDVYYIPTVKNQNDGKSIFFRLTKSNDTSLIFKNPEHDFPTKITYTKITNDSVVAQISGLIEGKTQQQKFGFRKVNM